MSLLHYFHPGISIKLLLQTVLIFSVTYANAFQPSMTWYCTAIVVKQALQQFTFHALLLSPAYNSVKSKS